MLIATLMPESIMRCSAISYSIIAKQLYCQTITHCAASCREDSCICSATSLAGSAAFSASAMLLSCWGERIVT